MNDSIKQYEKEVEEKRLKNINDAKSFYIQAQYDFQKYQKINELAKVNFIDTVKKNCIYEGILISSGIINSAKEYLQVKNDPTMSKLNDVDKSAYKLMNNELSSDRWFNSKIKIVEIVSYGYESYCIGIKFTVNQSKKIYELSIPDSSKINAKNFQYAQEGKMSLGYWKYDHLLEIVESSYDRNDIIKAFNELIKK